MGKQTGLYATVFDAVSDPKEMLNVMLKKLQLYNETEAVLKESRNKLILGFMKVAQFYGDCSYSYQLE
jgi:hypothetical protein